MYGNIGLNTPRGSGTSGYVQKNESFLKPKPKQNHDLSSLIEKPGQLPSRKPSEEVLLHNAKRSIEIELLDYRDALRESNPNMPEGELEIKVQAQRSLRYLDLQTSKEEQEEAMSTAKEKELEKMKDAFGIDRGYKEGQGYQFGNEEERKKLVKEKYEQQQRELFYAGRQ
jgi:serine/arginine repetitive matrix protein 2